MDVVLGTIAAVLLAWEVFYERAFRDMYQAPKHMEETLLLLNAAPPLKV
jgi:hypothetical protein